MNLTIEYFGDTDTLSLWNGRPASEGGDLIATGTLETDVPMVVTASGAIIKKASVGFITTGARISEVMDNFAGDIIANYDSNGRVVGFTIEHAAELLLHPLSQDGSASNHLEVHGMYAGYGYTLLLENGTLSVSSDRKQARSDEVAEHLTAHYDEDGDAAGFTLESAAELLLPYLSGEAAAQSIGAARR